MFETVHRAWASFLRVGGVRARFAGPNVRGRIAWAWAVAAAGGCVHTASAQVEWLPQRGAALVAESSGYTAVRAGEAWEGEATNQADPVITLSSLDIDADRHKYLYVDLDLQNARSLQVYFATEPAGPFNEPDSVKGVGVVDSGRRTIYRFDFSATPRWKGRIRGLRLDVDGAKAGSTVRLHAIGVSEKPEHPRTDASVGVSTQYGAEGGGVAGTDPLPPELERQRFVLPEGFEVDLFAAEPRIAKPMNLAFDRRGRMWVTSSVEYPWPAKDEDQARDTLKILEDSDGDGRADKVTLFADRLNIPIGVLPLPDGAIVYSAPNLYRYYDDDGDDRADRREVLYGPFGIGDTHGMINGLTRGFDGWIYACHGFSNKSTIKGKDGHEIRMQSGNTFRFRIDGSRVEHVTFGQVNPFGLCLNALGFMFTADCHSRPLTQLVWGGYYSSFGKPDDGLGFTPDICEHEHGSTGIAGVCVYEDTHFPPAWRQMALTGNVITTRLDRDRLERHGSTYRAVHDEAFMVSRDPWFRPVDIQLGPDGALYVADFYNRIIGHYEVRLDHPGRDRTSGRIWRIRYTGGDAGRPAEPPRSNWAQASISELIDDLGHPNLTVRMLATHELVDRGGAQVMAAVKAALERGGAGDDSVLQRVHGLWVLERLEALPQDMLARAAEDASLICRVHACRIVGSRPTWTAADRELAMGGLTDADGAVRQAAAQALASHPQVDQIEPLAEAIRNAPAEDPLLRHALRIALRDQLRAPEGWLPLRRSDVSAGLADAVLDVAPGVQTAESASFLLDRLTARSWEAGALQQTLKQIMQHVPRERLAAAVEQAQQAAGNDLKLEAAAIEGLRSGTQARGIELLDSTRRWADQVAGRLLESDRRAGIALVRNLKLASHERRLVQLASTGVEPTPIRKGACDALVDIDAAAHVSVFAAIVSNATEPMPLRLHAATLLGRVKEAAARDALISVLRAAPARLAEEIAAGLAASREGAERLLDEIAAGKASGRLLTERSVADRLRNARLPGVERRIEELTANVISLDSDLAALIDRRAAGLAAADADASRGAAVFQATCAACHRIGGKGGKVGPELDGIGLRGLHRLLEDTLDPSRNVDQAFRSTIIETRDGVMHVGILQHEDDTLMTLADSQGQPVTIPRDEITDRRQSSLSIMPTNIATDLPDGQFYDLMAYLLEQKPAK